MRLCEQLEHGWVLLPGHDDCARNDASNTYAFRQDSSFLYFIGLNQAGLDAVIDLDMNEGENMITRLGASIHSVYNCADTSGGDIRIHPAFNGLWQFAGPGHWNDPVMLEVGSLRSDHGNRP
jgi:hypothetical protein